MAIDYVKRILKKVNQDFDRIDDKAYPYHEMINLSKLTRLLLFFNPTNNKKSELLRAVTEVVDLLGSNKTDVNRLAYVVGLEVIRDLIGDENFNKKTLVNLDMRNKVDFLKRIRKDQSDMRKHLPEDDYLLWCETNELDPNIDDGYMLDFSGSVIKNWIRDQHRDESVYTIGEAIDIAIDERVITGDEKSMRNLKAQVSRSGASKGGKRGEWDFRKVNSEYQHAPES